MANKIFNIADGIPSPCNVARSWHWLRQVTAPCNVACGSEIVTVNLPSESVTCGQARDPSPLNWVRTNWRHWRFQSSSCERIVFLINVSTRLHPNNNCQESRGDDALPTGLSNRIQPGSKPSQGGVATPGHNLTVTIVNVLSHCH